jgi:putative hydrolase of the HAD superfamily
MIKGILFDLDGTLLDHRAAADTGITAWVSARAPGSARRPGSGPRWRGHI